MNYRQQLEQALPPATQEMLKSTYEHAQKAGIQINPGDLNLIARLIVGYLTKTKSGRLDTLMFLNATVEKGSYLKQYFARHGLGGRGEKIDYQRVFQYSGFIIDTNGVKNEQIIVEDAPPLVECEVVHARLPAEYCVVSVRDPKSGKTLTASNYARLHHEADYVKSTASFKVCHECKFLTCAYNPHKVQEAVAPLSRQIPHQPTPPVGEVRMIQ